MIRWLDTIPPLDRELGAYLLIACLVIFTIARVFEGARVAQEGRDHGPF